jgi:hypothetical protein
MISAIFGGMAETTVVAPPVPQPADAPVLLGAMASGADREATVSRRRMAAAVCNSVGGAAQRVRRSGVAPMNRQPTTARTATSAQLLQLVSRPAHGRSRVMMGVCAAHFRTWAPQARSCSGVVTGDWRNMICWSYNEAPGPCHFILPVAKHEGMATLFGWSQIRR